MKKHINLWFLCLTLILSGCSETATQVTGDVKLVVTQSFGQETMVEKDCTIQKDTTVYDVLESHVELNAKGDGFVDGINGVETYNGGVKKGRKDWFYYVNGICADVGATGYTLGAKDVIWWDYHLWKSMGSANAAVIGAYPQPFVNGYEGIVNPTIIAFGNGYMDNAKILMESLIKSGVETVEMIPLEEASLIDRANPTLILSDWALMKKKSDLVDLNEAYKKTGLNVYFDNNSINLIGVHGEVEQVISEPCGIIAATGSGLGDESPLWLISGNTQEGVLNALDVIVNGSDQVKLKYGLAITKNKIIALPIDGEEHVDL